jgi:C1A family cysteine protease
MREEISAMTKRRYGWLRDLPDQRDRKCRVPRGAQAATALPPSVDLRPQCPPVYDQGDLGSCTANAIAAALEYDATRQALPVVMPSRLFIYYNERVIEGTVGSDSGAQIRDGIKSVAQWGDCPETEWPYDVSLFATQPPQSCYSDAATHLALVYESLDQDLNELRGCLAAGFPFVFGFTVYQSFESEAVAQTGLVPLPGWFERPLGGHAVMAVGYDDASSRFTVRNSWGPGWGDQGYFYFPYAYMTGRLSSDFWTIRTVE